jgi:hypothetical protein
MVWKCPEFNVSLVHPGLHLKNSTNVVPIQAADSSTDPGQGYAIKASGVRVFESLVHTSG